MNILVTAGNTIVPVDRVRCLTNVFTGRTGTQLALHCCRQGHTVILLTSRPEIVTELRGPEAAQGLAVQAYRTFEDLDQRLQEFICRHPLDVVIHCAAVSDYQVAGVYAPAPHTRFRVADGHWQSDVPELPALRNRAAAKVKSDEPELWLRLVRTPKLIDWMRTEWGFTGILVKFKLEVGVSDDELLDIAERSRRHSAADLLVANTLEGAASWAYLGPLDGSYERVSRGDVPARLLEAIERLHKERTDG